VSAGGPIVSMIVPTHGREAALRDTLPFLLAVQGVAEIIVVDDASPDGTAQLVATTGDPRVRLLLHAARRGAPAGRNTGIEAAIGDWIVFGEDDVRMPPDYVTAMLATAEREGADIVSAPWLHIGDTPLPDALAAARAQAGDPVGLDTPSRFPVRAVRTPLLPALALISRRVLDAGLRYDEGYGGNGYREETDFFVRAARRGFVCVCTPETFSYQVHQWSGGQRRGRLAYEAWAQRNNIRFLRRHGRWLAAQGLLDGGPVRSGLRFAWRRGAGVVEGTVRARLQRSGS
jgi:glycosyltransferase involved in cell wall biosynthesis